MLFFDIEKIYTVIHKKEDAGFCFKCHARQWDGFVAVTDGECFFLQKGKKSELKSGDILFLREGEKYTISAKEPFSYYTSAFDFSLNSEEALRLLPKICSLTKAEIRALGSVTECWQKKAQSSYMFCKIQLLKLYHDMLCAKELTHTEGEECVRAAVEYIHNNFKRNFKSADIAAHCLISESHLRKKFLEKMGMTIVEYRDSLRLELAKELLHSGFMSVKETAYELGFCDVYYFTKFFKAHAYMTPGEYVKMKNV